MITLSWIVFAGQLGKKKKGGGKNKIRESSPVE